MLNSLIGKYQMTIATLWEKKNSDDPLIRLEIDGNPQSIRFLGKLFVLKRPGEWHELEGETLEVFNKDVAAESVPRLKLAGHRIPNRLGLRQFDKGKTWVIPCGVNEGSDCPGALMVNDKDEVIDCHLCGRVWKIEPKKVEEGNG